MSGVYFISDLHLGHKNVCNFREEFNTVEEHDAYVYGQIVQIANKRSDLYILGDVCFTMESFHYIQDLAERFRKVHIVIGNHDFENKSRPTINDYINCGIEIHGIMKYKDFWLSHAPIHPEELRGKVNIHGHIHKFNLTDSKGYVNVCAEMIDYKPISLDELRTRLKIGGMYEL